MKFNFFIRTLGASIPKADKSAVGTINRPLRTRHRSARLSIRVRFILSKFIIGPYALAIASLGLAVMSGLFS
jgi:hypothetical protein